MNQLSLGVLSKYLGGTKESLFLSFHMHIDITFMGYSIDIDKLYKKFFNDFDDFKEKRLKQREYVYNYFNKHVKDNIKLKINDKQFTLDEWILYSNGQVSKVIQSPQHCNKKDDFLHELQLLKRLYTNVPNFYLLLGNLFAICYKDYEVSLNYIKESINIDSKSTPPYISLMGVTYEKTKNLKDLTEVFDKMPDDIASNDEILFNYAVLHAKAGELNAAKDIARRIKNKDIKNSFFNKI